MMRSSFLPHRSGATKLSGSLAIPILLQSSGRVPKSRQSTCKEELIHHSRFIAAEKPPHLKAIAPWEGLADYYRELMVRGGIPNTTFMEYRGSGYVGKQ